MRVVSVNVGLPKAMAWAGETFESGIAKAPVAGRVAVRRLNLDGDRQSDLVNHGGPLKAVYAYPFEHYPFWEAFLGRALPMGALGENLTLEGMTEEVGVGDRLRVGTTELVVVQPRVPCFKLAALHGRDDVVAEFLKSGRSGFYLAVEREGDVGADDPVELLSRDPRAVWIADLNALLRGDPAPAEVLRRALDIDVLPDYWRAKIARQLGRAESP